jgi:hypothetical protein
VNEHTGHAHRRSSPGGTGPDATTAGGSHRRLDQARLSQNGLGGTAEAVKITALVVAPLVCALGALGGIGSFATVRHLAVPWFGTGAWIVPVGMDIGILALLAWDLLAEYLGLSWPLLRWTAWAFIAATTYLNIAAAHGNPTASIMHAAMPVLFVTVIEGIRHLIRQITGLAAGTRIERIPLSRWLLAPRTTFLLGRRMILWHVTSYRDGLQLEYQRLLAVSRLQQDYGRWLWRWRAPLQDRLALRLALETAAATEMETMGTARPSGKPEPAASLLTQLPRQCLIAPPQSRTAPLSEDDERLVGEAAAIMQDAKRQRARLSQAALARELRSRGHQIANERLGWLSATARKRLPREQPDLRGRSYDGGIRRSHCSRGTAHRRRRLCSPQGQEELAVRHGGARPSHADPAREAAQVPAIDYYPLPRRLRRTKQSTPEQRHNHLAISRDRPSSVGPGHWQMNSSHQAVEAL